MQVQDLTTEQKFILQYTVSSKLLGSPSAKDTLGSLFNLQSQPRATLQHTKGALCSATIPNSSAQFVKHKRFYLGNELLVAEI